MTKPSPTVTRPRCVTCDKKFTARRADARYCSGRCRQRANRARQTTADIDLAIEAARLQYWSLIQQKAAAMGATVSQVMTTEAQTVEADGTVYMHGCRVGRTTGRHGWTRWGLEAAGPPFQPPMDSVKDFKDVQAALSNHQGKEGPHD